MKATVQGARGHVTLRDVDAGPGAGPALRVESCGLGSYGPAILNAPAVRELRDKLDGWLEEVGR